MRHKRPLKDSSGITLMELLLAAPLLAIVSVAAAYALASSSQLTNTQIARTKCQIAASNVLTYIKAQKPSPENHSIAILADILRVNKPSGEFDTVSGTLQKDHPAHPDGAINLHVEGSHLPNSSEHGNLEKVFILKVTSEDFDVSSELKTYFSN